MSSFKKLFASFWEVAEIILIVAITVTFIRTFIAQPFQVSGASMEPNYQDGNYLLIDELTYRFRDPMRGEVIVFRYAGDPSSFFIKRIIGLPGETVKLKGGKITISKPGTESFVIKEDYISSSTGPGIEKIFSLGEKEYFVLGDNRLNSFDSRSWGALKEEAIIGIARLRLFPLDEFGKLSTPSYAN